MKTPRSMVRAIVLAVMAGCSQSPLIGHSPAPPAPPWESALAREAPLTGRIHDPRDHRAVSPAALIERLAEADFVLLGERHDNPDHHRLQAWIVERLVARGRPTAVAFEMIDGDQAAQLAAHLAASPRDAEGLGAALDWQNSGWPPWEHYRPIAAAAMTRGLPILAANLPTRLARAMARDGVAALPAPLARELALDSLAERPVDQVILAAHRADIQAAHCGLLPERALAPFALTQYARDAHMARVMVDDRAGRRASGSDASVILIAGAGHTRIDRGVPYHLNRLAPGALIVSLAFIEADGTEPDATLLPEALPYDLTWYTARVDTDDGCDKMRETMSLLKNSKAKN